MRAEARARVKREYGAASYKKDRKDEISNEIKRYATLRAKTDRESRPAPEHKAEHEIVTEP